MGTAADLYTTVKNVSGVSKTFGFIGKRGKTLASGGTATVFGNLTDYFDGNRRKQTALANALINDKLEIISTPRPILADSSPDAQVANPTTQATVNPTGGGASGGLLAAGTFQVDYTWYNTWGETTVGTGRSATFTVASTNIPRVTLPAIPTNATGAKIYLSAVNAPTGTAKYYNKITSGTTYDMAVATWNEGTQSYAAATAVAPTSNTTKAPTSRGIALVDNVLGGVDPSWGRYTG